MGNEYDIIMVLSEASEQMAVCITRFQTDVISDCTKPSAA